MRDDGVAACNRGGFASAEQMPLGYFGAKSFDISDRASCTVVMNWAGRMMVEFFSIEISAIV